MVTFAPPEHIIYAVLTCLSYVCVWKSTGDDRSRRSHEGARAVPKLKTHPLLEGAPTSGLRTVFVFHPGQCSWQSERMSPLLILPPPSPRHCLRSPPNFIGVREQDSLGGNCRTLMVACVWPRSDLLQQSLATLKFASRMRCVKNSPVVNERHWSAEDELSR